jgi:hypothetical protein
MRHRERAGAATRYETKALLCVLAVAEEVSERRVARREPEKAEHRDGALGVDEVRMGRAVAAVAGAQGSDVRFDDISLGGSKGCAVARAQLDETSEQEERF